MAYKSKTFKTLLFILLLWACPDLATAVTPPIPAHPAQYVVDLAGVLDANTQARLNAMLHDLEAKTTAQVVVLTIKSLDGEPIENFSHQTAVQWGIGQKGKDNGVLLTVAVKDHKYRIEVGYGLESTLPDSLVGSIGRQYLVPNFRKGDYAGGIVAAATEIAKTVSGGKVGVPGTQGKPPYHWEKKAGSLNPLTPILILIFVLLVIIDIFRRGGRGGGFWFFGGGGGWSSGGGGTPAASAAAAAISAAAALRGIGNLNKDTRMACNSKNFKNLLFILLLWAWPALALGVTPPIPAQPSQYVVDLAGVLDAGTQARLNARLKDLETETTAQMVVLTIKSLDGEPIESFSHQTAVKWGIGQKGKDNGVLLTVAVKDHKYRIEVGYGLESALPDSLVGSIGREYLVPNFRKGDYAGGIVAAVTEVINKLSEVTSAPEAEQPATPAATVAPTPPRSQNQLGLILLIVGVIVLLPAIALIVPRILWAKKRGSHVGFWSSGSERRLLLGKQRFQQLQRGRRRFRRWRGFRGLVITWFEKDRSHAKTQISDLEMQGS